MTAGRPMRDNNDVAPRSVWLAVCLIRNAQQWQRNSKFFVSKMGILPSVCGYPK
jgi:hypothetical protein